MTSSGKASSDYLLNFTFKQSNLFHIETFLRYRIIYNSDTLFVIQKIEAIRKIFERFQVDSEKISDGELSTKTRFIKGSRELFVRLCEEGRSVHLIEFIEHRYHARIKWLEASVGSDLAVLRRHLIHEDYSPDIEDFHLKYDRPVTIIFAGYGMGKTICLTQIKQKLNNQNKNQFILYVNDVQLRDFHNNVSCPTAISFIEFFDVDLTNSDVHIMYDNFECLKERDDIIDIMTDFHLNYRQVKQWITCSEIECRNKLESKLGTFACYLAPVTQDLQLTYLENIWDIEDDIDDTKNKSILNQCSKWYWKDNFRIGTSNFCSYPLHLKMIASMFKPTCDIDLSNVNILDVYETFVNSVYSDESIEELAVLKLFDRIKHGFKFKTDIKATCVTLEFETVIHYLAAKWFSKNFRDYQAELKLLFESGSCSWSFQYFFNSFLCLGMPLHTAVLNNWQINHLVSAAAVTKIDAGGRTALHLADDMYIMWNLFNAGAVMDVKDEVLQWTPLQYCDCNGNLQCLESLLAHGADAHQLTWSLNLSETEISKRFEFACLESINKLQEYIKFICQNVKEFQVSPEIIASVFVYEYGNYISEDVRMMVLNHAKKSNFYHIDYTGKTALFFAVQYDDLDAVKYLVNNLGFDIHHRCFERTTPFHVACERGFFDIVEYLLELGVDVNVRRGYNNFNAFTKCCEQDNVKVMKYLVDKGIDTNVISLSGETPLELACSHNAIDVVKYIFQNSASLNITYEIDYEKLLYIALEECSSELVEFLFGQNKQINVNKKFEGKTMLHIACNNYLRYNISVLPILIQAGADVNATDDEGCTPPFKLFRSVECEAVELLAQNGCNLNHFNNNNETALHVFTKNCLEAKFYSQYDYYELNYLITHFIGYGADVNARTPSGDTPLHFASQHGNFTVIDCLVLHGADIHAVNNKGETPLHLGCLEMNTKEDIDLNICRYFVSKGADVNKRTHSGKTPLMYAVHYPDNIRPLIKLGADIFCKDNDNRTLVHYFAEYGLIDNLKYLAELGMKDAKSVDSSGQTALHLAVKANKFSCFEYLINHFDTDINITDNNGKTASDLARANVN